MGRPVRASKASSATRSAVAARFDGGAGRGARRPGGGSPTSCASWTDDEAPRAEALRALETSLGKVAAQLHEPRPAARAGFSEAPRGPDRASSAGWSGSDSRGRRRRAAPRTRSSPGWPSGSRRPRAAPTPPFAPWRSPSPARRPPRPPGASALGGKVGERRFERLALELSEKVEAARDEMSAEVRRRAGGQARPDRIGARRMWPSHVQAAEQRSAHAIDRMGREVVKIAHSIERASRPSKARSAQAVEQVGGEMARIADAMESRMRSADAAQAEALEKLGTEIGRIAEKLADRIAGTERRSAQAIDDVGDQVVTRHREDQRSAASNVADDLADRIRQSEERTAKMLEGAVKLDQLGAMPAIPPQSRHARFRHRAMAHRPCRCQGGCGAPVVAQRLPRWRGAHEGG